MRGAARNLTRAAVAITVLAGPLGACGTDDARPSIPTVAATAGTAPASRASDGPPAVSDVSGTGVSGTGVSAPPASDGDDGGEPSPGTRVEAPVDDVPATVTIGPAERPTTLFVPAGYDPAAPAPLLLLLHGYTSSGEEQDAYLGVRAEAAARGYLYLQPDGTVDRLGNPFWNATDACCNFGGSTVDDSGHLAGLIAEVRDGWAVDPGRIWIIGHSNGGFMAHRMACDHADVVVGVVSIAGATFDDPASCAPSVPVSVVQVHGTDDPVIAYGGGQLLGGSAYPAAAATVASWAALDGCGDGPLAPAEAPLDLDAAVPGDETTVALAPGCAAGVGVELWTVDGGGHAPAFGPGFLPAVFDFLEAHARG